MTRIGINPARNRISAYRPARVTVAVIVYLPHLTGYFQNRLDVVRLSFETLFQNTDSPYDLLVFDNASCTEVKAYLQTLHADGRIRYLLSSSENIGKLGALRVIAGAAPGELIAYADDDTFFYPGWLKAHLAIFDHYPTVGMVSGSPERTLFDHAIQNNLDRAAADPDIEITHGKRIPMQWEHEWAKALGKDVDLYLDEVGQLEDIIMEYRGVAVYATACHNQFLSPKRVLLEHLAGSWSGRLMGGLNELDEAIDASGLLRLTTLDRTTKLIGNVVSPEMATEARHYGIQIGKRFWSAGEYRTRGFFQRLAEKGPIRWLLQGMYNRLFWILSGQSGEWVELEGDQETSE
jgi:glycosyltransferase involved in cell wall biosynthesis